MIRSLTSSLLLSLSFTSLVSAESAFTGRWALTIPGGGAGWLGVEEKDGAFSSSVLWGGGSVVPTAATKVEGDTLIVTREQKNKEGKVTTETITAKADGDSLKLLFGIPEEQRLDSRVGTGLHVAESRVIRLRIHLRVTIREDGAAVLADLRESERPTHTTWLAALPRLHGGL